MQFHWNAVIEGAVAGIVATTLLGISILIRDWIRNLVLRIRLYRDLRFIGYGNTVGGLTVSIRNRTGRDVTIRRVTLVTDQVKYVFNPTGEVSSSFKSQYPKLTRSQKRKLKRGESLPSSSELHFRHWQEPTLESGFATIAPFTSQQFLLHRSLLRDFKGSVLNLVVLAEYVSWREEIKIVQRTANGKLAKNLQMVVDRFREENSAGN